MVGEFQVGTGIVWRTELLLGGPHTCWIAFLGMVSSCRSSFRASPTHFHLGSDPSHIKDCRILKRVKGPYTLYMTAGGGNRLPCGNLPRLLMAWVSTEAVRTRSRELVLGRSLSEFMRKLGLESGGGGAWGARTRLRNQMRRLFRCMVSLIYEDERGDASVSSLVADRTEFWWNPKRPDDSSLWDSRIRLGEDFFNEIIRCPVPLDMNILRALKRSSLGLDLYMWLTYRTFALKKPVKLPWRDLYRQFGVNPARANNKRVVGNFRTDCLRELKKIDEAWSGLNYELARGALIVAPSIPTVPPVGQ